LEHRPIVYEDHERTMIMEVRRTLQTHIQSPADTSRRYMPTSRS
jgi:hypothetical protein